MSTAVEYLPDGMLVVRKPSPLPETLDLLVVGGGPAGTAAAFHALELGLSTLVIDYDDVMKRIRDYPKGKPILPSYGGSDQMRFPKGGNLISLLQFSPIDKDEMVNLWKAFYRDNNVPAQVGIELLGMERQADGVWRAKTWNHNTRTEQFIKAKHVAIGIGAGVPRRFDIPGNTDGLAFRLTDAAAYVHGPVLVIGGGTSAAEAVIAISNAKVKAGESSSVYWSYRGDKLPKVSKALADVFFEAYLGNGNMRFQPNSEPVAVVSAEDKQEYLSLRTDRKSLDGRPNETTHLEFLKQNCIACIGEDKPIALLNSLGILTATPKQRMVVNQVLETQQPNVYFIGAILDNVYLETDNFEADPATFREIKHRGNIKLALRDGVLVAKVVAQKVAGKKQFDIELDFADEPAQQEEKRPEAAALATIFVQADPGTRMVERPAIKRNESMAFLVRVSPGGVQDEEFQLKESGVTTIGRKFCDIVFPDDDLLSERHASVAHEKGGYFLRDDGSAAGVFLRAMEGKPIEVGDGDLVRIGRQFLLFKARSGDCTFTHYNASGQQVEWYPLSEKTIVLGREVSDGVTLDDSDKVMSRRHLSVVARDGKIVIKDLKSLNGTFLKVRDALQLQPGDQFRVGRQNFMLNMQMEKPPEKVRVSTHVTVVPPPKPQEPPSPPKPVAAPATGMSVTFKNTGKSVSFEKGQTICDIAEKNGVKVVAECHAGICGSDPIRIISGQQNLNPVTAEEKGTLEDICGLTPGECRLACMTRPSGAVEIEVIS